MPMGVSEPVLFTIETLRKDGSSIRLEYHDQIFYGPDAKVNIACLLIESSLCRAHSFLLGLHLTH